jgi:hypothetical protein
MFKLIEVKRLTDFFKVKKKRCLYFGLPVYVPENHKFVVTAENGIIYSSEKEPFYRGAWFNGKVNSMTPIARCEYKGDFRESKIKV